MIVDRARGRIILIAPNLVEQLLAGDNSPGGSGQIFQELEFLRGQRDGFSPSGGFHAGEIDARVAEGEDFVLDGLRGNLGYRRRAGAGAAHGAANASEKFLGAERLGYVIIGSELQQED